MLPDAQLTLCSMCKRAAGADLNSRGTSSVAVETGEVLALALHVTEGAEACGSLSRVAEGSAADATSSAPTASPARASGVADDAASRLAAAHGLAESREALLVAWESRLRDERRRER